MTARAWSPDAPYDSLNSTSLPASVFWKSSTSCLLAVFRIEKPTMLTCSLPLSPVSPLAGSEQAEVLARREKVRAAAPNHFTRGVRVMGRAFRSCGLTATRGVSSVSYYILGTWMLLTPVSPVTWSSGVSGSGPS